MRSVGRIAWSVRGWAVAWAVEVAAVVVEGAAGEDIVVFVGQEDVAMLTVQGGELTQCAEGGAVGKGIGGLVELVDGLVGESETFVEYGSKGVPAAVGPCGWAEVVDALNGIGEHLFWELSGLCQREEGVGEQLPVVAGSVTCSRAPRLWKNTCWTTAPMTRRTRCSAPRFRGPCRLCCGICTV